jgi:hypothetical protein
MFIFCAYRSTCSFMADTDLLLQNLLLITTGVIQQEGQKLPFLVLHQAESLFYHFPQHDNCYRQTGEHSLCNTHFFCTLTLKKKHQYVINI